MKLALPLIGLALCFNQATAQAPAWYWAQTAGGGEGTEGNAIATDADGNVFVTGLFTADNTTFGNTALPHEAYQDAFLTKYDAAGNVLWSRSATGLWYDRGYGVATDAEGDAIVVGSFTSPVLSFGDTAVTYSEEFDYDAFIAKYDPDGNVLWARSFGGNYGDYFDAVATDNADNIYVAGKFQSTDATFAGVPIDPGPGPAVAALMLKYSPDGDELWGRTAEGESAAAANAVATDGADNAVFGGSFSSDVLDLDNTQLVNAGSFDGFLVKYNGSGTLLWGRSVGDANSESIQGVATDPSGNVGITGDFISDNLTIGTTTLTNSDPGLAETFIAKYSANGDPLWAVAGEGGGQQPWAISCNGNGDFAVAGYFESEALSFGTINLDLDDYMMDVFVVKCSSGGAFQWAVTAGSDGQDKAYGISIDPSGAVVVCGWYHGSEMTFGGSVLTNPDGEGSRLFVAKMDGPTGMPDTAPTAPFRMWPNPASGQCTIDLPDGTPATVTISDGLGRAIIAQRISGTGAAVDVSTLAPGAYTVMVRTSQRSLSSRLVVAR